MLLNDRHQLVDDTAVQVPAYLVGQRRPVLGRSHRVVGRVMAGAGRVDAEHEDRPRRAGRVRGAAVDRQRRPCAMSPRCAYVRTASAS